MRPCALETKRTFIYCVNEYPVGFDMTVTYPVPCSDKRMVLVLFGESLTAGE